MHRPLFSRSWEWIKSSTPTKLDYYNYVCVRNPEGALCRHSNTQHGLAGFWLWGKDMLGLTTTWGPGPLMDCEFALSFFPDIWERETDRSHMCLACVLSSRPLFPLLWHDSPDIMCLSVFPSNYAELCGNEAGSRDLWESL